MSTSRVLPSELLAPGATSSPESRSDSAPSDDPIERRLDLYRAHTWHGSKLAEVPPRRWIVPGWLPLEGTMLLYGPPGAGKSFYAIALAVELARGGTWSGAKLGEPSTVLYLANERLVDLRDRVEAWSRTSGEPYPERLEVLSPPSPPQLGNDLDLVALGRYVTERAPRVVILDTFARMTLGKDENSVRDMGEVMEAIDSVRRATSGGLVIGVHHSGKDASRGMRGSTAILGAVDLAVEISGVAQRIRARVTKSNGGAIPGDEHYALENVLLDALPDEDVLRSCAVLRPASIDSASDDLYRVIESEIVELLSDHYAEGASRRKLLEALASEFGRELRDSTLGKRLTALQRAEVIESIGSGRSTSWRLRTVQPRLEVA